VAFLPSTGNPAAGSRVGGYVLEEQIGRGGMAVVFRALDERLGRYVALKILAQELGEDPGFRQRFIRESRAAAAVDDPHILPIYEAGEADGQLFIAMRYVQGGDVGSLLAQGALEPDRALAIIASVASALDAAHEAGLVHRDVKPANMLLDTRPGRADHVYLSDFGLTKGADSSVGLTSTGMFVGTVDYAAPEQIGGRPVDGRTDQYALACAAFEMLTGQPPFPRDQGILVLYAHVSAPPPRLSAVRAGITPAADAVFSRALAKSPEHRYPTCSDFCNALRAALSVSAWVSGAGISGHPPAEVAGVGGQVAPPPRIPDQPAWERPRPGRKSRARWPLVLIGAVAVVVAGAGTGAALALGHGSSPGAATGSGSGSRGRTPAASPRPVSAAEPGWMTYHDLSGFSVGLPPGWAADAATRTGSYPGVDFTGPAPGFHLFISWSTNSGARALPAWRKQAASVAEKDPTYRQIRLRQVSYRSYNSAVWEFTNIRHGVLTHAVDLGIVIKPGAEGYAIELYGPQSQWRRLYRQVWKGVLATFQPSAAPLSGAPVGLTLCGAPQTRPSSIELGCGAIEVTGIRWSTWTPAGSPDSAGVYDGSASGTGTLRWAGCKSGGLHPYRVALTVTRPAPSSSGWIWKDMVIRFTAGHPAGLTELRLTGLPNFTSNACIFTEG
jgi:Protein kinase domain